MQRDLPHIARCLVSCLLAASLLSAQRLQAQGGATVGLRPPDAALASGEVAEVVVWLEGVEALYGAQVGLRFDPAVIQVRDADPAVRGVQVSPGGLLDPAHGFVAANWVDNASGEILYAITLLAPAEPVSGSGELLRIAVMGLAPGTSEWLAEVVLATPDGAAIPVQATAARVRVASPAPTRAVSATPYTAPEGMRTPEPGGLAAGSTASTSTAGAVPELGTGTATPSADLAEKVPDAAPRDEVTLSWGLAAATAVGAALAIVAGRAVRRRHTRRKGRQASGPE